MSEIDSVSFPYMTHDYVLRCPVCDEEYKIGMPCQIYIMLAIINAFYEKHRHEQSDDD